MPRAKTRVASRQRRKKILDSASGYFGKRKSCIRSATDAFWRSGVYAYRDRRAKKRTFRALWIMRINAAARLNGTTYAKLMNGLKQKGIEIDRKMLANLAMEQPEVFTRLVAEATAA
jgi:large subunit ribosomal protein L20